MDGSPAGGPSYSVSPDISADGRYVIFHSEAPNIVPSDTNKMEDLFLRDTQENVTSRVNVGPDNLQADRRASQATISDDGRYIAFESAATNLVTDDTNGTVDVFVRDTVTATTTRVSLSDARQQLSALSLQAAISGDGKSVAFLSFDDQVVPGDTNGNADGFVADLATGHVTRVTRNYSGAQSTGGNGPYDLRLSANGAVVVYTAWVDDLVPRDLNDTGDVFAYTR
jgi:Tol biopolymer transport system component